MVAETIQENAVGVCKEADSGDNSIDVIDEMVDGISRYCAVLGIDGTPTGEEMEEMLQLLKLRRRLRRVAAGLLFGE